MDTVVTIDALGGSAADRSERVARAFGWFRVVEATCSRFDLESELRRLSETVGRAQAVSPLLFEAIRFALAVAADSRGAFDPTIGDAMAIKGFATNYRTGATVEPQSVGACSFRDVLLDIERQAVTLRVPLTLDLGAVAKGMAVDLAARELAGLDGYVVNAGGDMFSDGNDDDGPWVFGIRHPREVDALVETVSAPGRALCTSGDYERHAPEDTAAHHLLDGRTGRQASDVASVSVIADTAMAADAFATAAFALGPKAGLRFLERNGAEGLIVTTNLQTVETPGFGRFRA
jgi:thiamine biosynthesis lipoprotein